MPQLFARTQDGELDNRHIAFPAFPRSIFTTSEIIFRDAPMTSQKNRDAAFDTMEVLTALGSYDHTKGGHVIFWDDGDIVEFPVGATLIYPAGTKRISFTAVGKGEHQHFFRQFCHAGVLRWVAKGGRSDDEFDRDASLEDIAAWDQMRRHRGQTSAKLFSKLRDL
ncbi:hypothetical protein B0H13DRAFT_1592646 [Mycena leptocephala]|nr:hypothetical protein B0H13DRAFT_1592646 [Mycena leptocephala]